HEPAGTVAVDAHLELGAGARIDVAFELDGAARLPALDHARLRAAVSVALVAPGLVARVVLRLEVYELDLLLGNPDHDLDGGSLADGRDRDLTDHDAVDREDEREATRGEPLDLEGAVAGNG